jgi:hypothetical protein
MVLKPYLVTRYGFLFFLEGKKMSNKTKPFAVTFLASAISALAMAPVTSAQADDAFYEALTGGKVGFTARARYENRDDEVAGSADQTTLRTTLSYKTGAFHGFKGFIKFKDVRDLGGDATFDLEDTDVEEGYIEYSNDTTTAKLGKQVLTYRGAPFHRFIGNVLWRQNWQVFDAFSITNTSLKDTKLSYAYVDKRQFINLVDQEMDSHFFNVQYSGLPFGKLEGYAYLNEFEEIEALSTKTFGLRLSGAKAVNDEAKVIYTAEFATQDDYGNGTMADSQNYMLGELGVKYKGWLAKFSYELKEGDGTSSFLTPLGTNHAFQGWADQYLAGGPNNLGIEDMYVTVVGKVLGAKLVMAYHDYETDEGSDDLGDEFNILLAKKFAKHYTLGVKYADFDGGDVGSTADEERFWVWGQVSF